jgi:predicted MFS family arabinose efflux permease
MAGSAIGPVLGGTLVKFLGYGSLGFAAIALGSAAVMCFRQLPRATRGLPAPAPAPAAV